LRRRCAPDCVLALYFPPSQPRRYADVHAVFGTSNITRVLQSLPVQERGRAADTMATEAHWRMQDPVYGCTGVIDRLQQEIHAVQHELAKTRAQLAVHVQGTVLLQRT
ncbi:LOB domain-containing protein 24, partial [Dichanthelium oligosanthes]